MIIGVPKEIKNHEYRVSLTPASAKAFTEKHQVLIENNAGLGIGFTNQDYIDVGATIVDTAAEIFERADMIMKVKEPQSNERAMLRRGQILFTYLHLAPDVEQTHDLINSGSTCIAYETVTNNQGTLPLLAPMSEIAGRMSIQAGAQALEKAKGGSGVLLGGVPGVKPGKVLIIGGGVVGTNAAQMAVGLGADVTILDKNLTRLRELDVQFGSRIKTIYATEHSVNELVEEADLIIGAVLVPGGAAPKIITEAHLQRMKPGSAIVDVAIDQGGCFETSTATTHENPTFIKHGIVHYCVANMPGAVARTSTMALNNATLPFALKLADKGYRQALLDDPHLLNGLNVYQHKITCPEVAEALNLEYYDPKSLLNA